MIRKVAFFFLTLISAVVIYQLLILPLCERLFLSSLHMQLYLAVEKKCKNQSNCMVHLHEITHFKWDKAYFFAYNSGYNNQDIQTITGVIGDFKHTGTKENLALFTFKDKIVKYSLFETIDFKSFSNRNFFFYQFLSEPSFNINFDTNQGELRQFHYSGDIDDFKGFYGFVGIKYYELTPNNDSLNARCFIEDYSGLDFGITYSDAVKQCGFSFTNLDQIHLFNPKIDKKPH